MEADCVMTTSRVIFASGQLVMYVHILLLQMASQARTILREMEDGKLLSGRDYPISGLVSLRQTLADTGATVKPQTASGRDAIFRQGPLLLFWRCQLSSLQLCNCFLPDWIFTGCTARFQAELHRTR